MAKVINSSATNAYIQAAMSMEILKDLEDFNGQMANSMKENGYQATGMVQACGTELRETVILDSGNSGKLMDLECIFG